MEVVVLLVDFNSVSVLLVFSTVSLEITEKKQLETGLGMFCEACKSNFNNETKQAKIIHIFKN